MDFYATCAGGFERLLGSELTALGIRGVRPLVGQVAFEGCLEAGYTACMHSRIASRVVLVVARIATVNASELYDSIVELPWEDHLLPGKTLLVDAHGTNAELRNTHYSALRAKDAVSDRIGSRAGWRVSTTTGSPDLRLQLRIGREHGSIGVDLSGDALFRRGTAAHSQSTDFAPLRSDYAAALLAHGGWYKAVRRELPTLVCCGSGAGSLLVEAAQQVLECAPGLSRARWGFEGWAQHDEAAWLRIASQAKEQAALCSARGMRLFASDCRPGFRSAARHALRAAGVEADLLFADPSSLAGLGLSESSSLLVSDLSWAIGDELLARAALNELEAFAACMPDRSRAAVLGAPGDMEALGVGDAAEAISVLKGSDSLVLATFAPQSVNRGLHTVQLRNGVSVRLALSGSDQFVARLEKVARSRARWARREDVSCYRVYDADLPDYNVSLDLFSGYDSGERWLSVAEYAAPREVDPALAKARVADVLAAAPSVLGVSDANVFLRVRSHGKGGVQYASSSRSGSSVRDPRQGRDTSPVKANTRVSSANLTRLAPGAHLVEEGGLSFEVNFSERLDCGLFLDTRDVRALLREQAKHSCGSADISYVDNFLNLFAYTGTASVYAADGGAAHTTTVDLSRTYLEWARRNMARNGFTGPDHAFVQADVLQWVAEERHTAHRYQLIYCDPPTFSNSARMRKKSFDIQRDHAELIIGVSRLLARGGVCVFVCNLRTFKPDVEALAKAGVTIEDITPSTIPEDFSRTPNIHHCYMVRRY